MANKRGRKKTNQIYFGPEQEEAVINFLKSDDTKERNEIYEKWLKEPLDKMIESIIRRYKLYRKGISFEELSYDTLSFLMTKAHKFEGSKGKKAYSYYGTICKRYILGLLLKDEKYLKTNISYEDISESIDNDIERSYDLGDKPSDDFNFIKTISKSIKDVLDDGEFNNDVSGKKKNSEKKKISDNERKVGEILIEMLDNWETTFHSMNGGNKFNKISMLSTLREATNLSTKDIRSSMKRFKQLYFIVRTEDEDSE
jgi:hypothetical protein